MKKLITISEIKKLTEKGAQELYLEQGTIITPAARDSAKENGITLKESRGEKGKDSSLKSPEKSPETSQVTAKLVAQIVKEVMASLPGTAEKKTLKKEAHASGLRLVKGKTVECEPFNTGDPRDKVGIKEILSIKESPQMASGFMSIEKTSFAWDLAYEEVDYILEGTLEITVEGTTYKGEAGDVFYLPKDTRVTFSSPDKAKFFFVTYPANWAELSKYQN